MNQARSVTESGRRSPPVRGPIARCGRQIGVGIQKGPGSYCVTESDVEKPMALDWAACGVEEYIETRDEGYSSVLFSA